MQFFLLLLFIVMIYLRPQEWIPVIRNMPVVDFVAGINFLGLLAGLRLGKLYIPKVPENFLMFGFLFSMIMSHVVHTYWAGVVFSVTDFLPIMMIYFLILIMVDSERKLKIIMFFLILLAAFLSFDGILQYHRGYGLNGAEPYYVLSKGTIVKRIYSYGIFDNSNDLAQVFVATIPFILLFLKENIFAKVFFLALGGILLYGLGLTHSRGGMLGLAVVLTVYFFVWWGRFKKIFLLLFFLAVSVMLFIFKFSGVFIDDSAEGRITSWSSGNQLFKENPLFGVGCKMFAEYSGNFSAHNSFVNAYVELGFFGYFFWIALIYTALFGLWKIISPSEKSGRITTEQRQCAMALFLSIIGFLFCSFFLTETYNTILYILIALAVRMRYMAGFGSVFGVVKPSAYHVRNVVVFCVASMVLIYITIRLFINKM